MNKYYVIKDKNTGLYFRGKGVNRWGKYFNQASIYRGKISHRQIKRRSCVYNGYYQLCERVV